LSGDRTIERLIADDVRGTKWYVYPESDIDRRDSQIRRIELAQMRPIAERRAGPARAYRDSGEPRPSEHPRRIGQHGADVCAVRCLRAFELIVEHAERLEQVDIMGAERCRVFVERNGGVRAVEHVDERLRGVADPHR
jgi:hypothetical protein